MSGPGAPSSTSVSFVIVNFHVADKVLEAVRSIERYCDGPYEVVVVDNSESPAELARLTSALDGRAKVVDAGVNRGFGAGCNLGARHASGRYLFLLNPDARLLGPCVGALRAHLERHPVIGAVGAKLVYGDGDEGHSSGQFIGLRRPLQMLKGSLHAQGCHLLGRTPERGPKRKLAPGLSRVDWCSGAALLMRRADFLALGGFDERYFLYYEECDLQYRMQQRLGSVAAIDAEVRIFHEDGGTGLDDARKRVLIERGCLRFVGDHRSAPEYLLYKALLLPVLAAEGLLSLTRRDLARARAQARLLLEVARFHRGARGETASRGGPLRRAPPHQGGIRWDMETTTFARAALPMPWSRRAPAS